MVGRETSDKTISTQRQEELLNKNRITLIQGTTYSMKLKPIGHLMPKDFHGQLFLPQCKDYNIFSIAFELGV